MKKMFFIVGLTTICLTSCVKDYTCTCTISDSSGVIPTSSSSTTVTGKKNDVKAACDAGDLVSGTVTYACEVE
jgi:hypothetical protein